MKADKSLEASSRKEIQGEKAEPKPILCQQKIEFETLDKSFIGVGFCLKPVQHNGAHRISIPSTQDLEELEDEEEDLT